MRTIVRRFVRYFLSDVYQPLEGMNTNLLKYINGYLKDKFNLDVLAECKPVMGVDDLLLGLTHHWSRDTSIFPTEDDRLDLPTIMLFQAYTACRPAELVDGTKSRGGNDPLLDDDEHMDAHMLKAIPHTESETSKSVSLKTSSRQTPGRACKEDSDHASGFDQTIFDNIGHTEPPRKHKALCYEDIILWIVKDPKMGERDVLAMEVYFRHHKGADNKPKPYVSLSNTHPATQVLVLIMQHHIFVSRKPPPDFVSHKPYFGTRHPRRRNSS
jgi:hypothetical protein